MKLYSLFYITVLTGVILCCSCRNDFSFTIISGDLEFSKDTVYLDTVFTNIGSATYTLKVYNRSKDNIRIPSVRLEQGEASYYRLSIDGVAGKTFENIEILARDSIYIFIETTVDIQEVAAGETQFLYTDAIQFQSNTTLQEIPLVTLVQDAVFLYPQQFGDGTTETLFLGLNEEGEEIRIQGFFLEDSELTFTNAKPYIIYGYAAVPEGKTLTVEAGARVHFHDNSGLLVSQNATLEVNGALSVDRELLENEVIFEGDRLEPAFADIPGQWGAIWLAAGSTAHSINYLTIKNATVGILADGNDGLLAPTLTLKNTQIYNSSNIGLWAKTAHIDAENLVIGNAGQATLYCNIGGVYNFRHSTFANYWGNSFRSLPAVLIDNYTDLGGGDIFSQDLTQANFTNCIIYGNNLLELLFNKVDGAAFNYHFKNCLLRFNDFTNSFSGNPLYNFADGSLFENILLNENPDFFNSSANAFFIGEASAANNQADGVTAMNVPLDLLGTDRTLNPDIGAYQSILFPE